MKKGLLFVISAPSGTGKGTILNKIVNNDSNLQYSISATTRKPRRNEVDGEDYFFINKNEFKQNINNDKMLEYDIYCGNYYGTLKRTLEDSINKGMDIILEITVEGAMNVKKMYPESVLIFISPPSIEELEKRIRRRGTECEKVINDRLKNAKEEMKYANEYDYVVINDDLDKAVNELKNIINTNRN